MYAVILKMIALRISLRARISNMTQLFEYSEFLTFFKKNSMYPCASTFPCVYIMQLGGRILYFCNPPASSPVLFPDLLLSFLEQGLPSSNTTYA